MIELLVAGGLLLVFLFVVFAPLQWLFPRRQQRLFRPAWGVDLCFFIGQQLVWRVAIVAVLAAFGGWLDGQLPGGFREAVAAQPVWLQILEVVLLCDVTVYWGHRLSHQNAFLWRFHRTHHTAERLDFLAAYREHPVDGLWTVALENLPALILGVDLAVIAGFVAFRGVWAVFIHSNVRLPLGPLRVLLGAPELHHWHHDADKGGTVNFANLSPLMDVVFGTYYCPREEPEQLGLPDGNGPRGYLGQLWWPFRELLTRRRSRRRRQSAPAAARQLPNASSTAPQISAWESP